MTADEYLDAKVSELGGLWLEVTCQCGAQTFVPCKLLAEKYGALRVREVLGRLKCRQCGGRPRSVAVTNNPARGVPLPNVWRVPLV